MNVSAKWLHIYNLLFKAYGQQHWWPAESSDEIVIGSILTQNTHQYQYWHAVNLS